MKAIVFVTLLLLAGGCVQVPSATERSKAPYQVKTEGSCLNLNKSAALTPDQFSRKFDEHWNAGRKVSAASLARRFPEVGAAALLARDAKKPPTATEQALADMLDQMLPAGERRKSSDVRFPEHPARIALARAEAERRRDKPAAAETAWRQAALAAARVGVAWQDPTVWESVAVLRPVQTAWPAEVSVALLPLAPELLHAALRHPEFPVECLVWHTIGTWRLQRGEASAALSAFGKASGQGRTPVWDEFLQLEQARAWLALEQTPTAVSQLTPLTSRADSPWRAPALALLGSAKLHDGHGQQALVFLKEAVEKSPDQFPGRAEAEADLGLAYLSLGQEATGLAQLESARQRFSAAGQRDLLLLSLDNEIRYLEDRGHTERANTRRQERDRLQREI